MGATGSTIKTAMDIYKHHGRPAKFIALHLVITPEYLKMITHEYPELIVYAIRLDRGLSTPKALGATPGTYWDEEKGLNPKQYIVPGAGGFRRGYQQRLCLIFIAFGAIALGLVLATLITRKSPKHIQMVPTEEDF